MSSFVIEGGHKLSGTIMPQGAKNEALEVISAVLLTRDEVKISNVPEILDVKNLILLLQDMGVKVTRHEKGVYTFKADNLDEKYISSEEFVRKCARLRGSVMVVGPLLARFGHAYFPKPGGDKIGRRRVDTHIQGMINLGAELSYDQKLRAFYLSSDGSTAESTREETVSGQKKHHLKGCYMLLDEASVTGTANILMAATLADGTTTIYNAACEPYVQQLSKMLVAMGADITGIGSNLLTINGVSELHGAEHTILPDMIEVGSFIGMAAMNRSSITIKNVSYDNLGIIPECFRRLGIKLEQRGDDIFVPEQECYEIESFLDGSILTIADAPWPGLTPDLLSVMLVVATQCKGSVLIHQKMFESRLFFTDKLIDMGAQIILCDPHRAVVIGHDHRISLKAGNMLSPDIRAGIALLIAAMSAKGTSVISNIEQIDRGYEDIDLRLNALGACITRQD
ncbi:MAG: UDP-N-acetylglucosamine 1-carboxyvinyltransferase [Candidatus Cryptobacteroides sp.]|nr:UDP-N-acetylglucosamine 1-carboxyvinyltransferase [Bacteroidales bacterium]MDD7134085.1 UDP-N-acetylglucosamine 1-carboxyvinyltransferase [Bacteroidales bacterium]MDY2773338.1 UDP-N-acetylglucosamine 1-carboxyvinyltransferase [Candidatus Cryptobacteroides sp.]